MSRVFDGENEHQTRRHIASAFRNPTRQLVACPYSQYSIQAAAIDSTLTREETSRGRWRPKRAKPGW